MRLSRMPAATKTANPVRRAGVRGGSGAGSGSRKGWGKVESTRDGREAVGLVWHVRGSHTAGRRKDERPGAARGRPGARTEARERFSLELHPAPHLDDAARVGRRGRASEQGIAQVVDRILQVDGVEQVEGLDPELQVRAADLERLDQGQVHVE